MKLDLTNLTDYLGYYCEWSDDDENVLIDNAVRETIHWLMINLTNMKWFPENVAAKTRTNLKKAAKKHQIKLAFRAPADLNFCSLHSNVHQAMMSRAIEFIEFCQELEAKMIHFSLPSIPDVLMAEGRKPLTELYPEPIQDALSRALHVLFAFAEDMLVCIDDPFQSLTNSVIQNCVQTSLDNEEIYLVLDNQQFAGGNADYKAFFRNNWQSVQCLMLYDTDTSGNICDLGQGILKNNDYLKLFEHVTNCPVFLKSHHPDQFKSNFQKLQGMLH